MYKPMINDNLVAVELTTEEVQKSVKKLKELQTTLQGQLVALQPRQRQELPKMSDKTMPFVEKMISYADSRPEFVPFYLSVEEMKVDFQAVNDLKQILREAQQLCTALNDTIILSGSEAYTAALAYYSSVKQAAANNVPHAQAVYEDLRKRFEKK